MSFDYSGMPLELLKKVGKYRVIGGLGAEPPAGSRGSTPVGVQGGEARAFSQSELPRKPPIDTHGRYTYNTCTKKKSRNVRKKVGKTASLIINEHCNSISFETWSGSVHN